MRCEQKKWTRRGGWLRESREAVGEAADLVLCFGAPGTLDDGARWAELCDAHPAARVVGCSSGGNILGRDALDEGVVAIAIDFDRTRIELARARVDAPTRSFEVGRDLARRLRGPWLSAVLVLSDGLLVNGTELVAGLTAELPSGVVVAGGLAGDGAAFGKTIVGGDAPPEEGVVVAVGMYGERLSVKSASESGFAPFGPERRITRSRGNVLYELDGGPALALYERYLGARASDLPSSGLLFPLHVQRALGAPHVVRSVLSIDRDAQTMTFAGDVPEGARAWFMRGARESLVQCAGSAAARASVGGAELVLLVSCIGRKLVMGQRSGDEIEAVAQAIAGDRPTIGFYAYGEIAPSALGPFGLHNQTMTVTTFVEA